MTASSCPPRPSRSPLKFQREGITYDELSEDEKDQWDALEWDDEGTVPDRVEAEAVNKWLFNKDHRGQGAGAPYDPWPHGPPVGDRLGKTILFAKNQGPRGVYRRTLQRQLPALQGASSPVSSPSRRSTRRA